MKKGQDTHDFVFFTGHNAICQLASRETKYECSTHSYKYDV